MANGTKCDVLYYGILKIEWLNKQDKLSIFLKTLNLRKMNLGVIESNKRAVKLYEKLDFIIEGHLINHVSSNGKFVNVLRMALFNQNYLEK